MTPVRIRQSLLASVLALSLAASWWTHRQEERADSEAVAPAARENQQAIVASTDASAVIRALGTERKQDEISLDLKRLTARELAGTDIDAFRAKSWFVPPPPPPPEPPPKPTAPPLPFQFVGKTDEIGGGKAFVYLTNGNEFHTVSVGDKFGGNYQLERIDRGALRIRYLPLSIIQTLPIGTSE